MIRRGFDALSEGVAHVAPPVEAEASAAPSVGERALDLLGDEVRTLAEPLLDESLESPDAWSREIERYLERVRMAESVDPPGRLDAARHVADRLLALVESVGEDDPSDHHRLAQMAVRYFTMEDDASDDRGAGGYEDDDEVVGAVEAVLEGE